MSKTITIRSFHNCFIGIIHYRNKKGENTLKRKKYITIFEDVICKKNTTILTLAQQFFYKKMNSNIFKTKVE
jgi:hypothetical protein